MDQRIRKYVIAGIIAVVLLALVASTVTIVQAGHSGVVLTTGAVSDTILSEGMHFKIPFAQSIIQVNNRTQNVETMGTAASKDLQIVSYTVAVNYRILNESSASLYKNVGLSYEATIVMPAIQESIKAVTAQFTAEELITQRSVVGDSIKDNLQAKIAQYGISVQIFNIVNFDFSDEFNKAVEAKQTAQQSALKAEQDLVRIEVEAQQKITQAEAEAASIRLIQETLKMSPEYIEYIKWNKWNGELPNVMVDSSNGLILDIGAPSN